MSGVTDPTFIWTAHLSSPVWMTDPGATCCQLAKDLRALKFQGRYLGIVPR